MARSVECRCDPHFTCGYCLHNAKPYYDTTAATAIYFGTRSPAMCSRADDPTMHDAETDEAATFHAAMRSGTLADYQAWEIAAAALHNGGDLSPTAAFMAHHAAIGCPLTHAHAIAECRIAPHPFRRDRKYPHVRNDRCLTCDEYEEDGPHIG